MTEGKTWGRLARAAPRFARLAPGSRWLAAAIMMAMSVLLVACGDPRSTSSDAAADNRQAASPVASPASPAEASPAPSLGDVVWAASADPLTNAPRDEVAAFPPDAPRITAFVLADALPAGSEVQADWTYNDTTLDAFTRQIVVPTATDQTWLSFHIDRGEDQPWPNGVYEVTIWLNGQLARQAAVAVAAAP